MKKSKLLIEYDFDFELMGVSSAARSYKLAWELNRQLGISLVRQPDLVVGFRNQEEKCFHHYSHDTPLNRLKLFKNKPSEADAGKYYLIPEFPHYDFIILAAMDEKQSQPDLLERIRSTPSVQLVGTIPVEGLKSKSNFIF